MGDAGRRVRRPYSHQCTYPGYFLKTHHAGGNPRRDTSRHGADDLNHIGIIGLGRGMYKVYNTVQLVSGAGHGGARRYPGDSRSDQERVVSYGDAGDARDTATSHPRW